MVFVQQIAGNPGGTVSPIASAPANEAGDSILESATDFASMMPPANRGWPV
jgi:hypothetical protein